MAGSAAFRIQLFTKLALFDTDQREVRLPTKKALVLLLVLVLDDQCRWSRADLSCLVWPETNPEMARSSLRSAIRMLRKATGAQSVSSEGDEIWLDRSLFQVDMAGLEEICRPQDCLPGLSHEWVTGQRLKLVSIRLDKLILSAERLAENGDRDSAVNALDEAAALDPDNERISVIRNFLLKDPDSGIGGSRTVMRSQREGERESFPFQPIHPLIPAAEYLLAIDPDQALEFLASTHEHWKVVPVKFSADLFRRVLRSAHSVGSARRRVEAMGVWFEAIEGSLDPSVKALNRKLSEALSSGDRPNAYLIATAISIAAQQRGALDVAYKYAKIGSKILLDSSLPDARPRALFQLANIERHCGMYESARAQNLEAIRAHEDLGSGIGIALARLTATSDCIWSRDFNGAAEHLENAREYFHGVGDERIKPWIHLADAWLAESSGNPERARQMLVELRNDETDRNGLAFQAGVEDHLLVVETRLGEWDQSAIAWGRSRKIRRMSGLAPTTFERDLSRSSKVLLREKVGLEELRNQWGSEPFKLPA